MRKIVPSVDASNVYIDVENEKSKAVDEVSRSFLHDIRTPLTTLSMICSSINSEIKAEKMNVEKISKNAHRAVRVLKETLFFTALKAQNLQIQAVVQAEKFDIADIVADALNQYPFANDDREIFSVQCDMSFEVVADRDTMLQVLFNLIRHSLRCVCDSSIGSVVIRSDVQESCNKLSFENIDPNMLNYDACDYSKQMSYGSSFCKNMMLAIGGNVVSKSVSGECNGIALIFSKKQQS